LSFQPEDRTEREEVSVRGNLIEKRNRKQKYLFSPVRKVVEKRTNVVVNNNQMGLWMTLSYLRLKEDDVEFFVVVVVVVVVFH